MTIDQTASERQLHRVLYVIKMLRALVLHVILAVIGATLYFTTGANAYPVATAVIQAMRAAALQVKDEAPATQFGFVLGLILLAAFFAVALTWIYRALASVNRRALRIQAILVVLVAASTWPAGLANLRFAFGELDQVFAILAATSVSMTTVIVPIGLAVALVRVSRLSERSSFVATLDPRLAPTRLVYLLKLLDLPRTPLRTSASFGAFALALTGALLMVASLLYLITVGGASNKAAVAVTLASYGVLPEVVRAVDDERFRILLLLPFALAGVKVSALLQAMAKRVGGLSVSDVLTSTSDRFLLYLRPFELDEVILPRPRLSIGNRLFSFRPYPVRIEEELFDVADGYLPLIAIGKPGTSDAARGGLAYRTYLADSEWQAFAADHIQRAERIVMVIEATPGVRWEIDRILEGAAHKTLFFFRPPSDGVTGHDAQPMILDALRRAGVVRADFSFATTPLAFYLDGAGGANEIVNENWSATSYRTAFSYFLGETASASPHAKT